MRLRDVMDLALRPGVLSLAIGLPAAELFPREALAEAASRVLRDHPDALQYGVPHRPLKTQIVELMAMRGVRCTEEQVFLTTGAQQGMDLLTKLLAGPGARVAIEWAVFDGIQLAARQRGAEVVTLGSDPFAGIDVDEVEALLAAGMRPAYLYLIPEGHNPLGVSLGLEPRRRLAELACRFQVPILEDDAYGFLHYGEPPPPPLRALEEEQVFYLGSFSKILAPGLRAGWVVAPEAAAARLPLLKQAADVDTPSLGHRVASAYLEAGGLPAHLERLRAEYRRRRDAMLEALRAHLPSEVRWNHPTSGMFVWVELPEGFDGIELLRAAVEREGVAFSPGVAFCAGDPEPGRRCLRLSFASQSPERIEEGVRRLGRAIRHQRTFW